MELDLGQPATQFAAAILFLVPGLNATWFLERLGGPNRLKGTEIEFVELLTAEEAFGDA